jgi:hypothetical protein
MKSRVEQRSSTHSSMPQGLSKICLVLSRCADTLNSFEEMRQNASMIQEQWIIGLTTPTVIGDIASFVHRIPECDLKADPAE